MADYIDICLAMLVPSEIQLQSKDEARLAWLSSLSYDVYQHHAKNHGGSISAGAFDFELNAGESKQDFEERRISLFEQVGLTMAEARERTYIERAISPEALKAANECVLNIQQKRLHLAVTSINGREVTLRYEWDPPSGLGPDVRFALQVLGSETWDPVVPPGGVWEYFGEGKPIATSGDDRAFTVKVREGESRISVTAQVVNLGPGGGGAGTMTVDEYLGPSFKGQWSGQLRGNADLPEGERSYNVNLRFERLASSNYKVTGAINETGSVLVRHTEFFQMRDSIFSDATEPALIHDGDTEASLFLPRPATDVRSYDEKYRLALLLRDGSIEAILYRRLSGTVGPGARYKLASGVLVRS